MFSLCGVLHLILDFLLSIFAQSSDIHSTDFRLIIDSVVDRRLALPTMSAANRSTSSTNKMQVVDTHAPAVSNQVIHFQPGTGINDTLISKAGPPQLRSVDARVKAPPASTVATPAFVDSHTPGVTTTVTRGSDTPAAPPPPSPAPEVAQPIPHDCNDNPIVIISTGQEHAQAAFDGLIANGLR